MVYIIFEAVCALWSTTDSWMVFVSHGKTAETGVDEGQKLRNFKENLIFAVPFLEQAIGKEA